MDKDISKIENIEVLFELQKDIIFEMIAEDDTTKRIDLACKYIDIANRIDILNIRNKFNNILGR